MEARLAFGGLAFALATLHCGFAYASSVISAAERFRALEALYFLPMTAFPAGELHALNPGDIIDINRGTVVFGIKQGSNSNDCLPELQIRGPYDSAQLQTGYSIDAQVLVGGSAPVGPGGLIQIDASGHLYMSRSAFFEVAPLAQKDPSGGERSILLVGGSSSCSDYHEILDRRFRGRAIVSRSFRGREALVTTLSIAAGASASLDKSEILSLLETAMGLKGLPLDSIALSADGKSARFSAISKPEKGELAIAFVPMHLNKEEVAAIHYYLAGSRGVTLRSLVDEALNSAEPDVVERALDRLRQLFGRDLADEQWARRFLEAPGEQEEESMQLTSEVIEELEREVPGVLENLSYYAAAVELSGGRSGIGEE